ncbi:phytanoyl-CoA dioxygenase [Mangrovactinospora gilvigrisea]|uniref:Phytanoyl-CoA dioxygenase n=1 Tax=Mangrovactinospora gilvigrisea TaxID=1428644 RepID=A0A1J7C6B0_9ACTN|nr:phytanoyl-CoA dioxygenase family protein [Mangrovactinospora gilvigrisea]OIV37096.1 phytanoyl-CoA dioxygenase [Mangrovactinospora gilvigrisea]
MSERTDNAVKLTTKQVAQFVAQGFLQFDAVVPDELNQRAMKQFDEGVPQKPYAGMPLEQAYPEGSLVHELLNVPVIRGAIHSLVGPDSLLDHHALHVRTPAQSQSQTLHADSIIDVRDSAFDIQLMYYPHEVTREMGGTLVVPGSHLRKVNEGDVGRYQNLAGQKRLVCPAGSVLIVHHGIWHCGRKNVTDRKRYMFKVRLNPTIRQVRLWDTADLDDPEVPGILAQGFPWYTGADGRLEVTNRARLWRHLIGDESYDTHYWLTRIENVPQRPKPLGALF